LFLLKLFNFLKNFSWANLNNGPLICGVSLALIYYFLLHPVSSLIGGLIFLFVGWLIPDLFLVCVSLGAAKAQKNGAFAKRVLTFLSVALLVTIIPSVPSLVEYSLAHTTTNYRIYHKTKFNKRIWLSVNPHLLSQVYEIYSRPLLPRLWVGSDEGCMCFYFHEKEDATYARDLSGELKKLFDRARATAAPINVGEGRDQVIEMEIEKASETTYNLRLNVKEDKQITASFWQNGLPSSIVSSGSGRIDLKENFFSNATTSLLQNTFFVQALSRFSGLSYFPRSEIRKFFNDAFTFAD
jgi:hypothetical protein